MQRRTFLKSVAVAGVGAAVPVSITTVARPAAVAAPAGIPAPGGRFPSGVASGDPSADGVVIWTRVRPPGAGEAATVAWQVAADADFADVAAAGTETAGPGADHTVKLAVEGLDPNTWWYYRFSSDGVHSPTGRTRTAPAPGTTPERLRIGFTSCQSYADGTYDAWAAMAAEDLDLVLFLGDYIYETGGRAVRTDPLGEARDLATYRAKYRLYRSDPSLQAAHANFPFVTVWDDHEVHNNYDRYVDPARQAAGYQAWFENMAVLAPEGEPTRIHRSLPWGDLAELFVLDTRQYRDPEAPLGWNTTWPSSQQAAPGRTILGEAQRSWLKEGLTASTATWKLVGNQVVIMPWRLIDVEEPLWRRLNPAAPPNMGFYLNGDSWDGYQAERRELLGHLEAAGTSDVMFLTGDVHSFWAGEVRRDFDDVASAPVATEFVGGAISSTFLAGSPTLVTELENILRRNLGEIGFLDLSNRGYGIADVTPEQTEITFVFVDSAGFEAAPETGARFRVAAGTNRVEQL